MVSEVDFADLAKKAANTSLKADVIETARLDEIEGSDGDRVMRVRLIGADEKVAKLDGDELLDASTAIGAALRTAGEPLRIVVEYAGQRELDELGSH